jgi:hypothetical protein
MKGGEDTAKQMNIKVVIMVIPTTLDLPNLLGIIEETTNQGLPEGEKISQIEGLIIHRNELKEVLNKK